MTLKPGRCLLTSFTLLFFIPLSSYQDEMAFQQTIQVRNKKYRVGFGRSNFTRLNQKVAAFFSVDGKFCISVAQNYLKLKILSSVN
jgi:hypothetical protein